MNKLKLMFFKLKFLNTLKVDFPKIDKIIEPAYGLELLDNGEFKTTNIDPQMLFKKNFLNLLDTGLYLIKIKITSSKYEDISKLYIDYGNGFEEKNTVIDYIKPNSPIRFLVFFESKPKALRFDPFETKDVVFRIETIVLKKLPYKDIELFSLLKKELEKEIRDRFFQVYPPYEYKEKLGDVADENSPYANWIRKYEKPEFSDLLKIKGEIDSFKIKPKISIIMPVYNTPEKFLREAIDSVIRQSYPNWELCIADDNSTEPHVKEVLDEYKKLFPDKIKVVYRKENGHICKASNSALEVATGEFVGFLDHDDTLSEHALYYVVKEINKNPDIKIIYTDEDKIDADSKRYDPHFKSDWNPDLLLSQNYIAHFLVIRKDIIDKIGGYRKGTEGAQDHDLVLRASLYCKDNEIVHIPKILYHWRSWEKSTAYNPKSKTYTENSGIEAIKNYLKLKGVKDAKVVRGKCPNTYRVLYPIPNPPPLVSIIIPTKDKVDLLKNCINSILNKTKYKNYEILIIDNRSEEEGTFRYFEEIKKFKNIRVIKYDDEFNFSAICNFGVKHAKGELILLLNNDTEVLNEDWLEEMVRHAIRKEIGCVGAKLYYPDGTIQHGGVILGLGGVAGHSHKHFPKDHPGYYCRLNLVQNLSAVTAACLMVKKEIYEEVGGLDEENLKVAFNDVDFCLKVREAGYRNLWTPYAELIHHESKSRGYEDTPEKIERFRKEIEYMKKKWGKKLLYDPYYNPNLTLDREDFGIKC